MINIKQITSQTQWEEFLNSINPHTFLQSWEWGMFQEALGHKIYRLGVFENNNLYAVAFIYKIQAKRGTFLFCPHGPVINYQLSIINYQLNSLEQILQLFFEEIKRIAKSEKADFIRISPMLENINEIRNIFKNLGFHRAPIHMHPELAWMLDITPTEEELLKNMRKNTRYSCRKAQKDGVKIIKSTNIKDIDNFYDIYKQTAYRQNFTPFSKEYIKQEFAIFAKNQNILLFSTLYKNEIIAAAIIIYMYNSGFYHHGASTKKYPNITASELLQWSAIKEAKSRRLKLYNFWGIIPKTAKNHSWYGLTKFKQGFGGFSEEYLPAQDFVLSPKYWLNYIIETGRRIKRGYILENREN